MTAIAQAQRSEAESTTPATITSGHPDRNEPLTIRTTGEGTRWVTRITRGNWVVYITPTAESETDARRLAQLFLDELKKY